MGECIISPKVMPLSLLILNVEPRYLSSSSLVIEFIYASTYLFPSLFSLCISEVLLNEVNITPLLPNGHIPASLSSRGVSITGAGRE